MGLRLGIVVPVMVFFAFSSNLTYACLGAVLRHWLAQGAAPAMVQSRYGVVAGGDGVVDAARANPWVCALGTADELADNGRSSEQASLATSGCHLLKIFARVIPGFLLRDPT